MLIATEKCIGFQCLCLIYLRRCLLSIKIIKLRRKTSRPTEREEDERKMMWKRYALINASFHRFKLNCRNKNRETTVNLCISSFQLVIANAFHFYVANSSFSSSLFARLPRKMFHLRRTPCLAVCTSMLIVEPAEKQ